MKISPSNKYSTIGNKRCQSRYVLFFFLSFPPLLSLTNYISLGSWFVLERWIADTPFQYAFQPAQSDLDVTRCINAKEILERHRDTWIIEEDLVWIAERGINTVRIPVSCLTFYRIISW
jgi:aryl-phospho-beta-D-glucosidase BglC (GH1 family)